METVVRLAERYRLDRPIAAGGMGEVWRGFDTVLERRVAVKVLRTGLETDTKRPFDRFAQEAKTLAGLRGPGLVDVYDYGEDTSGRSPLRFIVMEFIEGVTLARMLAERGTLEPEEVLRYMSAAAGALETAHAAGVVHRDIKPANLIIESTGRLRVVDFGISLIEGAARLTLPGRIMGTPSYVSPEQLSGWEVHGAADLYALGAVAYECLAGKPPFAAEDPHGVVHMHLYEDPPPLPDHVPAAIAGIVADCLHKSPERRWPTAAALAAACQAAIRENPAAVAWAAPSGRRMPARHRRRSHRVGFLIAVILVLTAIGAFPLWHSMTLTRAADPAPSVSAAVLTTAPGPSITAAGSARAEPAADETPATADEPSSPHEATPAAAVPSTTGEPTPASGRELPNVLGMDASEARSYLNSQGWTDVRIVSTLLPDGAEPKECAVVSQNPKPETVTEYDQTVKIAHWGLNDCP